MDRGRTQARGRDVTARFTVDTRLVVLLGPQENTVRSREERREDGRVLLVAAACLLLGADPAAVSVSARCARCGGDHGRPFLSVDGRAGLVSASVSHAGGATVAVVAERAVGVDAEPLAGGADRFAAIRAVAGPWASDVADGADALTAWTTIESVVKADGRGLEIDPGRVHAVRRPGGSGTTASIDGVGPFYAVSSALVDGLVLTVALGDATG